MRILEGHEELVRCIRFDSKRIVSGAYDGKIKVWDLVAALDPRAQANTLCLKTLVVRCFPLIGPNVTNDIFFLFVSLFVPPSPRQLRQRVQEHTGRVFRLQFDEFQIVSSSHDDTILIWDFLNYSPQDGTSAAS